MKMIELFNYILLINVFVSSTILAHLLHENIDREYDEIDELDHGYENVRLLDDNR